MAVEVDDADLLGVQCQQHAQQFAKVGQEQGAHARVEVAGILAADGKQSKCTLLAQRHQRGGFNRLGQECLGVETRNYRGDGHHRRADPRRRRLRAVDHAA